ncbi:hypothetical protein Q8F55_006968 [Vanrija albida]|uniref:F-box domain-containing protein n=1 Tax=Vanrija albida TaxID=181172 RepID=A0ABR3PYI3_9TREE
MLGPGDICPLNGPPAMYGEPAPQPDSALLALPSELLHRVLCEAAAESTSALVAAALTCRALRAFVFENPDEALWRDVLLRRYDDPRRAGAYPRPRDKIDWKALVKERSFAERVLDRTEDVDELARVVNRLSDTLVGMYLDLPPKSPALDQMEGARDPHLFFTAPATRNGPILERLLGTPAFHKLYAAFSAHEPEYRQNPEQTYYLRHRRRRPISIPALARLHALLVPRNTRDMDPKSEAHAQASEHRGYARELVYSGSHYREDNDWAPLRPDGSVDWTLVDAIGDVMMLNAQDVLATSGAHLWSMAILPMSYGIESVRGLGLLGLERPADLAADEPWDWAGIGGLWHGSYAFMEYRHWVRLNEPHLLQVRRGVPALRLSDYDEAIGDLMLMRMIVDNGPGDADDAYADLIGVKRSNMPPLPRLETQLPTSQHLPPLYFHGTSTQLSTGTSHPSGAPHSFVRGVVRLTADDPPEMRWTIVISYGDADRWRLEGVQVGGRGSKRGFVGVWTDADREEHSPNGPVWYWKSEASSSNQHPLYCP